MDIICEKSHTKDLMITIKPIDNYDILASQVKSLTLSAIPVPTSTTNKAKAVLAGIFKGVVVTFKGDFVNLVTPEFRIIVFKPAQILQVTAHKWDNSINFNASPYAHTKAGDTYIMQNLSQLTELHEFLKLIAKTMEIHRELTGTINKYPMEYMQLLDKLILDFEAS